MAKIKPLKALRPSIEAAQEVSCVPYDVVSEPEVREFIKRHPESFLKVTRPEADFQEGENPSVSEVFARARQNLESFIDSGILNHDHEDAFYIYQLEAGNHLQTGLVGCCSLDEYESGVIKKHENVRPDKVEDRTEHLLAVRAQTGLIFLAFRCSEVIRTLLDATVKEPPLYEFECADGIWHRMWRVTNNETWADAFAEVSSLYIADGHHRAECAALARKRLRSKNPRHTGAEPYNLVLAGMFPADDLQILAYNRIVKDINGLTAKDFFDALRKDFVVAETTDKQPSDSGIMCMYFEGRWYKLTFDRQIYDETSVIDQLDVSILHKYILEPILGIADATTDTRIGFVGGKRGVDELENLVDSGDAVIAFSMFPTTMDDLLTVSDSGEIMPPKSTWFEPKLKDGLLVHLI